MRAEALRENEDFEKRKGVNFEWQQKTLKFVIENLFEKRDNSESPKKVGIYIMGGGMKAASLSGVIWALNRMGLSIDVFDVAVGASSGSVLAASFVGGPEQTEKGIKILERLSSKDFIDTSLPRMLQGEIIKLRKSEEELRSGPYALNQDVIKKKNKLYITVSELVPNEGKIVSHFINPNNSSHDIPELITGSMTLPGFTGPRPIIEGREAGDGAFVMLPAAQLTKDFPEITDWLVLCQDPYQDMIDIKPSRSEVIVAGVFNAVSRVLPDTVLPKVQQWTQQAVIALSAKEEFRKTLEQIKSDSNVTFAVFNPIDEGLSTVSIDPEKAKAAAISNAYHTFKQFGVEPPTEIIFDERITINSEGDIEGQQSAQAA